MIAERFEPDALIEPMPWDVFFSSYWERQYLHISGRDADHYKALLTVGDLEELLSREDARYPEIRLAKGGGYYASEMYTRNVKHGDEAFTNLVDTQRVIEEYRRGATVAVPAFHRTCRPLGQLCEDIQARWDHPAHANVYITPANAAGFTPHYDVHEVFALQIAGKKTWSIYEPIVKLPQRTRVFAPHLYRGQKPIAEIEMAAGDLLYIPRGFLHSTVTSDRFSAHITLGVTVYTWADLINEHLSSALGHEELRGALPRGFATNDGLKAELAKKLLNALDMLRGSMDPMLLIDAFTSRVRGAHVRPHSAFKADLVAIDEATQFHVPPVSSYAIMEEEKGTMLEFQGQRYLLPAPVASTVRVMVQRGSFRAVDLPDFLPPEGKLGLSRHLHNIGFVTLAPGGVEKNQKKN